MQLVKRIIMLFFAVFLLNVLIACQEQEGPAERAGEKVDETVEQMGEKAEEAGDKIKEKSQN